MKIAFSREKLIDLLLKGKKKTLSIGIIIFTLITTLVIYGIQAKKIGSLQLEKEAEIKKNEILNDISQTEKKIRRHGNILKRKDASVVIESINEIAKGANVKITSIKPHPEKAEVLYIRYPFAIVFSADSFHLVGKFISKMENHPNAYFVDSLRIRQVEETVPSYKELPGMGVKPATKLVVNLVLSTIAFKDQQ